MKAVSKKAGTRFQPASTRGLRAVRIRSGSYDPTARTFEFVLATERPVRSYRMGRNWDVVDVDEVLPMAALTGLETFRGAPLLDTHSSWSVRDVLGRITALRIEGSELIASAFLSGRDDVAGVAADIEAGILQEFSVGFEILDDGEAEPQDSGIPLVRVRRWTVLEGSLVPIPADPSAFMRGARSRVRSHPRKLGKRAMTPEELKAILTAAFATATDTIVGALTEDGTTDADIEAEAKAAAEEARAAVLAKKNKTDPTAEPAAGERSAADKAAILGLRTACLKRGLGGEFDALEKSGATLAELRGVLASGLRTNPAEISTQSPGASGAKRGKIVGFAETARAKQLAGK